MNPLLQGITNPITQMLQNNPNMQTVKKYMEENNGDAQKAFYKMASDMGINPEEALKQIRNMK